MRRSFAVLLCSVSLLANPAFGQSVAIAPVRVAAGAVLKFHLQTRLNQTSGDALDALPKGTVLEVRMLDSVDSDTDRDGTEFHGTLVTPLVLNGQSPLPPELVEPSGCNAIQCRRYRCRNPHKPTYLLTGPS